MMRSLRTRYEAAVHRIEHAHVIPPITDPLGRSWAEPSRGDIDVDDRFARMSKATLEKLADYSASMPSGVYPGKMWRCRVSYRDESQGWLLRWYGVSDEGPQFCSNHQRRIVLLDAPHAKPMPRCVHGAPMDMRCPYCAEVMRPAAFPDNPRKA